MSKHIHFSSNYYFPQVFVAKALIQRDNKYLLIREPETSSWKPGKIGLPGGKIDPGENWLAGLEREISEEIGAEVHSKGIVRIEEIVYHNPKVDLDQLTHHVIVLAELVGEPNLPANAGWYTKEELQDLEVNDLTEFYLPSLFALIAQPNYPLIPLNFIQIWMQEEIPEFKAWYKV
jgi:8-oxo-dGTP pyrophosphatase MutT (NUDIX family)